MIFRPWKYEDVLPISLLEEKCFLSERWNYPMFASSFTQPSFLGELAEQEGEILAYACVSFVMEECDLLTIAVAEKARRKGLGREILKRISTRAKEKGVKKMFLEVRESNTAALSLYRDVGFTAVSERKRYYPDGETALVMMREL